LLEPELFGEERGRPSYPLGVLVGLVVAILGGEREAAKRLPPRIFELGCPTGDGLLEEGLVARDDLLGLLALRDVARNGIHQPRVVVRARAPLEPAVRAVRAQVAVLEVEDELPCLRLLVDLGDGRLEIVGMDELDEWPRLQLLELEAEHPRPCRVQLHEMAVERRRADEIERKLLLSCEEGVGFDPPRAGAGGPDCAHHHDDGRKADRDCERPCRERGRLTQHLP